MNRAAVHQNPFIMEKNGPSDYYWKTQACVHFQYRGFQSIRVQKLSNALTLSERHRLSVRHRAEAPFTSMKGCSASAIIHKRVINIFSSSVSHDCSSKICIWQYWKCEERNCNTEQAIHMDMRFIKTVWVNSRSSVEF